MLGVVLGKKRCKGVNKDGQAYDYDKFTYGVPDEDGVGLTCETVNIDHCAYNGTIPLFEPVGVNVGMRYGKLKVMGFDSDPVDEDCRIDNIIKLMREGKGGVYIGEEWD